MHEKGMKRGSERREKTAAGNTCILELTSEEHPDFTLHQSEEYIR